MRNWKKYVSVKNAMGLIFLVFSFISIDKSNDTYPEMASAGGSVGAGVIAGATLIGFALIHVKEKNNNG